MPEQLELPSRYQFDDTSGTLANSKKFNCCPAVMTAIAQYMNDAGRLGIEATRTIAGVSQGRPATYVEAQLMLAKRGVRADLAVIDTLAELQALVRKGRRPVGLGIRMSRVPPSVRGHSFLDWHMVACRGVVTRADGTEIGFDVMDPNFSPPGGPRPDPLGGHRFYSNTVMKFAFIDDERRLAVVPRTPKPRPTGGVGVAIQHIVQEMPMSRYKAEAWKVGPNGAPLFDGIGGNRVTRLVPGTLATTIAESNDNLWRWLLVTLGGKDQWLAVHRSSLIPLVQGGSEAFNRAIKAHLISREP